MVRHGEAPFLECSSGGDRRFSAFWARLRSRDGRSIEDIYQSAKVFADGRTNLNWQAAKGKRPVNEAEVRKLYATLWDEYIEENPHLKEVLVKAKGLSDRYGRPGGVCQATELWRIRLTLLSPQTET